MRYSDIRTKGRRIDEWMGKSMKISRKMGRGGRISIMTMGYKNLKAVAWYQNKRRKNR